MSFHNFDCWCCVGIKGVQEYTKWVNLEFILSISWPEIDRSVLDSKVLTKK